MIEALIREMALQQPYLEGQVIETIYFGGGTPSLLSADELMRLWAALEKYFPQQELKEVTLEANPDNLTPQYIGALRHTPVNRLSIGIQSFHDKDLQYMNRAHTASEADYAVKLAQDSGFEQLSLDLIYGTPTMTDKEWEANIRTAIALDVPHISSYALTVEPHTALAHSIAKGKTREPDAAQAAAQFEQLTGLLAGAGYEHYEISNFARPGQYALHNTRYWMGEHYLGLGPSAHSYNGHSRQWNIANNSLYLKSMLTGNTVPFQAEELTVEDRHNEYLMTSLRTMWGTKLSRIAQLSGADAASRLRDMAGTYIEKGWLELKEDTLLLSAAGKLFADRVAFELFL